MVPAKEDGNRLRALNVVLSDVLYLLWLHFCSNSMTLNTLSNFSVPQFPSF